jgi:membrane protease YdiL (CAAX protease family)
MTHPKQAPLKPPHFQASNPSVNKTVLLGIVVVYFFITQVVKWKINSPLWTPVALAFVLSSPLAIGKVKGQWVQLCSRPKSNLGRVLTASYVISSLLCCLALSKHFPSNVGILADNNSASDYRQLILLVLLVPLTEEFFFRSFLYGLQNLSSSIVLEKRNFWQNLHLFYVNALIFWIFHLPADVKILQQSFENVSIPLPLGPFFLGIICCFITHKDGSIFWAIVFHAFANLSAPFWSEALTQMGVFELFYF